MPMTIPAGSVLDAGVTTEQAEAINVALAPENNADNLRDFAANHTFISIAAALLAINANLFERTLT
jgi:hypothetical protein